ncbi:MAG: hypothetical protein WDA28_13310 [Castellaniella sp.]
MDAIVAKAKEYEYICVSRDPEYENILSSIELVKDFIIKHDLVLYGGTGLDMALRLKGDKIYPDTDVPDLDFYSPNSVEHAYELAGALYRAGFEDAVAFRARYVRTMRVDIGGGHVVADITYYPAELFAKLPTLKYNGMRIVHPLYQRIDMHNSLSHPYDNPPMEVIFDRWGKDIRRFNQMNSHYPVECDLRPGHATVILPTSIHRYVLGGWAAYALIYHHYLELMAAITGDAPAVASDDEADYDDFADESDDELIDEIGDDPAGGAAGGNSILDFTGGATAKKSVKNLPSANPILSRPQIKVTDTFVFEAPIDHKKKVVGAELDIISLNPQKHIGELGIKNAVEYEPYVSMIPSTHRGKLTFGSATINVRISSSKNKLVSVNTVKVAGVNFKIANVQLLMKDLAALFNVTGDAVYVAHYYSLLSMITSVESAMKDRVGDPALMEMIGRSPLFPSIYTYGADNHSLSYQVLINKAQSELGEAEEDILPWNYYPNRSIPKGYDPPSWRAEASIYFRESGKAISAPAE